MSAEGAGPIVARWVTFELDVEDGHPPVGSEALWCTPTESGDWLVDNVPFCVPGLALGDTVSAEEEDGVRLATGVVQEGGHSTVRVVFFGPAAAQAVRAALVQLGCAWEGMKDSTFTAVDVPPDADHDAVLAYLSGQADAKVLDREESCIQH